MKNTTEIKEQQLGMTYGKAAHILRRKVMFSLICDLGLNRCFQCDQKMSEENFSLEHKKAWLHEKNPKETFFDLANIAFSHQSCNYSARRNDRARRSKRSGFRGVHLDRRRKNPWRATHSPSKGKQVYFGEFPTAEEAARAYDAGVMKVFGSSAMTNKSLGLLGSSRNGR